MSDRIFDFFDAQGYFLIYSYAAEVYLKKGGSPCIFRKSTIELKRSGKGVADCFGYTVSDQKCIPE